MAALSASRHWSRFYQASIFDVGTWLARVLPLNLIRFLAGAAGSIYARSHPAHVAVVLKNLQLLGGSVDAGTARGVYREFGKTLADYFYIGTRPMAEAVRIIAKIDGEEHLQEAHREGKGALIVTAHLGLFELGGLLMGQSSFPCSVLTLPEPTSGLTEWRARFRRRWNTDTIEIGTDSFAFIQIAEKLRAGQFIATLIDRPHPTGNTAVSFPNGTVLFSSGILLLAAHTRVPVIPATMVRRADGSYHAQVFAPFIIEERESRAETLRFYSQKIADTFLPVLSAYPEQWYQFVPLSPAS